MLRYFVGIFSLSLVNTVLEHGDLLELNASAKTDPTAANAYTTTFVRLIIANLRGQ